jgi:hypothetical protein
MGRTQLLGVRRVRGLGDEAEQYTLQSWGKPQATMVLGVARTGRITTVALTRTSGSSRPDRAANLRLLVSAVDDLCPTAGGGPCSSMPEAEDIPAPPTGTLPMMVSELDLPPVAGVDSPWVGTTPRRALTNLAATGCDESSFAGRRWRHAATRSFLVPDAQLADTFGLTETVGRQTTRAAARRFVTGVRTSLDGCSKRDLGTKVVPLADRRDLSAWQVRTQVSDKQVMTFYMGVARAGSAVAQVGFVPDGRHSMTKRQFIALVQRAGERLAAMPR